MATTGPVGRTTVLLIEDDPVSATYYTNILERPPESAHSAGFNVVHASTAADGLARIAEVDALILDLNLPNGAGLDLITRFQEARPGIPILVVSGHDFSAGEVISRGAQDVLAKPITSPVDLIEGVTRAIARHKVRRMFTKIDKEVQEIANVVAEKPRSGS